MIPLEHILCKKQGLMNVCCQLLKQMKKIPEGELI